MNECLNCGKEVKNKYCDVSCQNSHRAKEIRKKYYNNPRLCKCCGKVIEFESKRNIYCSHSCSAKDNNVGIVRNIVGKTNSIVNSISNEEFIKIISKAKSWKEIGADLGYQSSLSSNVKEKIIERCINLHISCNLGKEVIKNGTKREIFNKSKSWQSARSTIRKDAAKVFEKSGREYVCYICGYTNHVEIAHIKAVSEFDETSSLEEINVIENLVALCPNHHWEYDNGLLKL